MCNHKQDHKFTTAIRSLIKTHIFFHITHISHMPIWVHSWRLRGLVMLSELSSCLNQYQRVTFEDHYFLLLSHTSSSHLTVLLHGTAASESVVCTRHNNAKLDMIGKALLADKNGDTQQ